MKSKRRSSPRSAQSFQRRVLANGDRTLAESKCPACGQIVGTVMDESPDRGETAASFPDLKKLLHFSQQLYAHALTLQEIIRNEGEATYEALRPKYDRVAAQQFKMFYRPLKQSSGLRKVGPGLRVNSGLNQVA
jgi:rRNA maturation protein Nop10